MDKNKTVRILVVAPLGIGGITNMMINIQKHLKREKINFDYLTFHDRKEPCEAQVAAMGSQKFIASADGIRCRSLRCMVRMNKIRKICKENHIKILHYNADSPTDLFGIIAAKLGGVKYVTLHSHNSELSSNDKITLTISNILRNLIPIFCDNYYACSHSAAKFLFPRKITEGRNYSLLPNGIDLQKYKFNPSVRNEVRKELGLSQKFIIVHAGRFCEQKNHSYLLEIFKKVYEKDKSAVLLLFGTGELMDPIKKKAAKLEISEAVIFYGTTDQMSRMWQAADILVMPSLYEGLPVTGIEAQASGLKCIFSDCITRETDITDTSEFLSLDLPPEAWADTILQHKKYVRSSGVPALEKAGYDIQKTADIVSKHYLTIIENIN